jgi:hypothetical protein
MNAAGMTQGCFGKVGMDPGDLRQRRPGVLHPAFAMVVGALGEALGPRRGVHRQPCCGEREHDGQFAVGQRGDGIESCDDRGDGVQWVRFADDRARRGDGELGGPDREQRVVYIEDTGDPLSCGFVGSRENVRSFEVLMRNSAREIGEQRFDGVVPGHHCFDVGPVGWVGDRADSMFDH